MGKKKSAPTRFGFGMMMGKGSSNPTLPTIGGAVEGLTGALSEGEDSGGGLPALGMALKKQKFGEPKTPFTMKGSPFQRNFGISPLKQEQTANILGSEGGGGVTPTEGDLLKQRLRDKVSESGSKQGSAWANIK